MEVRRLFAVPSPLLRGAAALSLTLLPLAAAAQTDGTVPDSRSGTYAATGYGNAVHSGRCSLHVPGYLSSGMFSAGGAVCGESFPWTDFSIPDPETLQKTEFSAAVSGEIRLGRTTLGVDYGRIDMTDGFSLDMDSRSVSVDYRAGKRLSVHAGYGRGVTEGSGKGLARWAVGLALEF